MFSSATQDCANKFAVAHQLYGFPFTQPFPDLDHLECLILVGANPAVSKWSFLQVSHPIRRLKELEARGVKVFIGDPRRTETAKVAGEHIPIRPNTDVFFYLSFLHELLETAAIDRARIDQHMTGFDEVCRIAEPWPPERTAEVTRIPPETLRAMVRAYREAKGAALYCSTGVNMGVMVLFLFVVMMLDINLDKLRQGFWDYLPLAGFVSVLLVIEMALILGSHATSAWR